MNYISKLYVLVSLTRLLNVIITFCSVIVALIICSAVFHFSEKYLMSALAASLSLAAGNVINDVFDLDTDSLNKPQRPLPSGKISKTTSVNFYILLVLFSLAAGYLVDWMVFSIVFFSSILLFLYSFGLKRIPFLGNFVISFLTGFVFIYGGIIAGNVPAAIVPAGFAFLINLAREGIKSIEDIPGDKISGIVTFPQKYGINFSRKLISAFLFLLLIFTFVPFVNGLYDIEYFIVVMVLVNPLLIYVIKSLLATNRKMNLNKLSLILKLNMIFGLTAIYFGR
jgi:geranylgeranylglycerol-phosphate geranylgeranyltransferase